MKPAATAVIFAAMLFTASCSEDTEISTEDRGFYETGITSFYESAHVTVSLDYDGVFITEPSSATEAVTSISETEETSSDISTSVPESVNDNYEEVELSMLEQAGNPDYHAEVAIPYVAWTEVNLQKTMYTVSKCEGYEFALPDAARKMIYDPGIALEVIARTSTDFYRIQGDYYIPCDFLDSTVHEGINAAAATSCTAPPPPPAVPAVTSVPATSAQK